MEFDPAVKDWKLQRSWGSGWRDIPLDKTCTGTWCGLSNKDDQRKFSIAFREGRDYQIRIVAYKNKMTDTIKWGAFDKIDPLWEGLKSKTEINKNSGIKKTSLGNFSISSPNIIRCVWGQDNKKHCESIIILENKFNQPYQFQQNKVDLLFERSAEKMTMEISTNYQEVIKEVIDWDCIERESERERDMTIERAREIDDLSRKEDYFQSICKEEVIDYEFTNWQPLILSSLNQVPANSVIGIKIQFDTELWRGSKTKNNFNISLTGQEFDLVLDPEIDDCSVINSPGTYTLNQTLIMGSSPCIDINTTSVVLDCDGYKIDGTSSGNAIEVSYSSGTNSDTTILDCSVDDTTHPIYLENADNINVTNFYSWSARTYGIYTRSSDSGYYKNITLDGDGDPNYGWYYYESNNGEITDLTTYDSNSQNFRSYDSTGLTFTNVLTYSGPRGMVFRYPYSGASNNDIINLTSYDNTYTGLQLDRINDVDVSNSTIYNNSQYDFEMSLSTASHCDGHSFTNVNITDKNGGTSSTISYYDTAGQTISNSEHQLIVLCDADNSLINNVNITNYAGNPKNGILMYMATGVNITNSRFENNYIGADYDPDSATSLIQGNQFTNSESYDLLLSGGSANVTENNFTKTVFFTGSNNVIYFNEFHTGTDYVIWEGGGTGGLIYNNIFNKTNGIPYVDSSESATNDWNVSQQAGERIVGEGTDIGGNVYFNSSGGFYYDCADSNLDGICDNSYDIGDAASEAIDYGALSDEFQPDYTCTCPGEGNNWEVDMEDMCTLSTPCNLGTGNLTWTGSSGYFNCSAQLNLTNRDAPPSGTTFYYSTGCEVNRQ
jgi:hypothetical protein